MSFTSPVFFLFLPVTLLLCRMLPGKYRWAVLLPASCLFYGFYDARLLWLILLITLVSYLSALCIEKATTRKGKQIGMAVSISVCLGALIFFKYLDFATGILLKGFQAAGWEIPFDGFHILLPMGISFYVFQAMSYTIDVFRGTMKAERHPGYYALFVVFFPQLAAGPISLHGSGTCPMRRIRLPPIRTCSLKLFLP